MLGLIGARPACAAGADESAFPRFELTPFLGYRLAGTLGVLDSTATVHADDHTAYGAALSVRIDEDAQYGLFYSRQPTTVRSNLGRVGLNVEYIHLDGEFAHEYSPWVHPYVIGALGLTRLSVDAPGSNDGGFFSLALGGGLRIPVRAHIDLRVETRAYLTFIEHNSSIFCASGVSGGTCALRGHGTTFVQYDFLVGAAYTF